MTVLLMHGSALWGKSYEVLTEVLPNGLKNVKNVTHTHPGPYQGTPDPDAAMRRCMELEDEQRWLALADYLIKHMALRRRLLADGDA